MHFEESPPHDTEPELYSFLERMVRTFNAEIGAKMAVTPIVAIPDKIITHKIYYCSSALGSGITAAGYWVNDGTTWVQLG